MVLVIPAKTLTSVPADSVSLGRGLDRDRWELTRDYLLALRPTQLIQNHLVEACRLEFVKPPFEFHGGWEAPTSAVRGTFVGHWMCAAAQFVASTGDPRLKGTLDHLVRELAICQQENGGEWLAGVPEKYLHRIGRGQSGLAPMYVAHKALAGLHAAYVATGNEQALEVVINAARWYSRFTDGMTPVELDNLLDWETGGVLQLWADLYATTQSSDHLTLIHRFENRKLISRLVAGEDPLTNRHANQTVPEILGAARAYDVTGESRWREAVEAYWHCAVTERGYFATGGQTFGECWTPPQQFAARLGPTNQEHCVVFNMMRLAERLLEWTGEARYADYLERNRLNGIYAQQNRHTGMVAYYLPLQPAARKLWATPTDSFWCCVGTQVEAGSRIGRYSFFRNGDGLTIADYVPATVVWSHGRNRIRVIVETSDTRFIPSQATLGESLPAHRPGSAIISIVVEADPPIEFDLSLRLPWWLSGRPRLLIDGEEFTLAGQLSTFHTIRRTWSKNEVQLHLPKGLTAVALPDDPSVVAFMDGPEVLAGLCTESRPLSGGNADPTALLHPSGEFKLGRWRTRYVTRGQPVDVEFVPLHEVDDETYTVYFTLGASGGAHLV